MADIKTCEEYVLSELSDRECKIEALEKEIKELKGQLKGKDTYILDYDRMLELLSTCLCIRRCHGYTFYINGKADSDTVELLMGQFVKHGYPLLMSIED